MIHRPVSTPPASREAEGAELARVREVYDAYATNEKYRRLWANSPASRFMQEHKWARIRSLLREAAFDPLAGPCLDLGSGGGDECRWIVTAGIPRERIVAFDLLEKHVRMARQGLPGIKVIQGDARHLPFPDDCFSFVYQSTMLSSVLDQGLRRVMLEEVRRVLSPGGMFLSFDTRYRNPWNPHTRPLPAHELRSAFAGWPIWVRSANGIPQLIRLLAPVSELLCRAVEGVPPLRSHLLVAARKPAS
jgi:ubiquinone/menaquinone biosynthesis C-methylase UbiE